MILILGMACAQKTKPVPPFNNDIDAATFKAKMTESNMAILDVRTSGEVAQGKIEGAIHIDIYDKQFKEKIAKLDKSKEYLVYCKVGGRSANACKIMAENGFSWVNNLKGGYLQWPHK